MDDASSKRPKRQTGELVIFDDGFILGRLTTPNAATLRTRTITARRGFQKEAAHLLERLAKGDPLRHEPQWWTANFAALFEDKPPAGTLEDEEKQHRAELLSAFMKAHGPARRVLPEKPLNCGACYWENFVEVPLSADGECPNPACPTKGMPTGLNTEGAPPSNDTRPAATSCTYGQDKPAVRRAKGEDEYSQVSAKGGTLRASTPKALKKEEWETLQNAVCEVGARVWAERAKGTHGPGTLFELARTCDWKRTAERVFRACEKVVGERPTEAELCLSQWEHNYPDSVEEDFGERHAAQKEKARRAITPMEAAKAERDAAWLRFAETAYLCSADLLDAGEHFCGLASALVGLMFGALSIRRPEAALAAAREGRTTTERYLEGLAHHLLQTMEDAQ